MVMNDDEEFCGDRALAVWLGAGFTVCCYLPPGHEGDHESPDFYWADGDGEALAKY